VTEERKARRFDRGGAWGKRDSIVLVAKESGGMWNNKIREICQNNTHPGIVFYFNAQKNAYFIVTPQWTNRILF
jgi:hypothetical protein